MKEYKLLFDTISESGNISLLCNDVLVDIIVFTDVDIKTDSLLTRLSILVSKNGIERKQIKKVIYTSDDTKSGKSQTKMRIFRSILLGLKNSLDIEIQDISNTEIMDIIAKSPHLKNNYASDNDYSIII